VLDFACGSGSLLLNVRKKATKAGGAIGKIFGQEKNITTYNLARMNMLLHGVKDSEFEIYHGDTLLNEWDILRELNPAKKPSFDAIVANPPFSYRWEPTDALADDVRFKNHGLAPKSAADFAFLLHGFHFLKDEGVMAIQHRKAEPRYARRVEMVEIEKNDFNLNISRYISTAVSEEEIDLTATHRDLVKIEK
jgi:type I restriction enzyme M protein